jgi:MFS family permease
MYAVSVVSGAVSAFDGPARQAVIPNLVPREELSNAFTLNTVLRQTATVVGPGIGGLVIGFAGLASTYAINAASFLAVIVALLLMSPIPQVKRGTARGWDAVLGGLSYARSEPLVLTPLALDFIVTCCRAFRSLLPVFARDVLAVGPQGLGLLHSASSAGALGGALVLTSIGEVKNRVAWMLATYALQGIFLIGFGLSQSFPLSLILLFGYGIGDVVSEVMRMTIVQLKTPDELRGRVSALGSMFTQGGPQLGQLQMGAVATLAGPVFAAVNGGTLVLIAVAVFSFLPSLRSAMKKRQIEAAH